MNETFERSPKRKGRPGGGPNFLERQAARMTAHWTCPHCHNDQRSVPRDHLCRVCGLPVDDVSLRLKELETRFARIEKGLQALEALIHKLHAKSTVEQAQDKL